MLLKLAEMGSMRRTAEAVNMTQPAISQIVAELEKLLEVELFFRHARGVEPTEATKALLPVAKRVLTALEDGAETIASHLQEQDGVVRVFASPAGLGGLIYGNLDQFAINFPNIQVHITQSQDRHSEFADDSADIVCTRMPGVIPEGWVFEQCMPDELVVVCGRNHPFANEVSVDSEALGQALWLLNRVGSVARDRFEEVSSLRNWPMTARCQIVMHIPDLTKEMLLTGRYLAILPRSVALPWLAVGDVVELATEINTPLAPLGFLWKEGRSGTATATFAAHLMSPKLEAKTAL